MYKNKIILGSIIVVSFVAAILGITSIAKPIFGFTVFEMNASLAPESIANHINVIKVLGVLSLIIALACGIIAGYLLFKEIRGFEPKAIALWIVSFVALISLIFGIIAMAFNNDLSNPLWLSKQIYGVDIENYSRNLPTSTI